MKNKRQFFGTDGIRGRVGQQPITPDFLVRLGFAIGKMLAVSGPHEVLVAKDTRRSGYMVEASLEAGLTASGADVLLSGPLPTSAVSYLTPTLRLSAGIVISGSHNHHEDNGVKLFSSTGQKLPDAIEYQIEKFLLDESEHLAFETVPGRARRLDGASERYIEFCKRAFPVALDLRGLRLLVDCANGASYHVAPPLFHELGADVVDIGTRPDGFNINLNCGVLSPQFAQEKTVEEKADIGIILDGDADRVSLVDEKGCLYDGDAIIYLIVQDSLRRGLAISGVVGTVLTNLALSLALRKLDIDFVRVDVGDRYVLEAMSAKNWSIGGEPSGHIVLKKFHQTGDGIIAALQVLRAMRETEKPLSALMENYRPIPQVSANVEAFSPKKILALPDVIQSIEDIRSTLTEQERLVVRPSGTESKIRIMIEGENTLKANQLINQFQLVISKACRLGASC